MESNIRTVSGGDEVFDQDDTMEPTTTERESIISIENDDGKIVIPKSSSAAQVPRGHLVVADEFPEEKEESEEEDEYEYEDDDDVAFSGFLDNPAIAAAATQPQPAKIEEEDPAVKPKWRQPTKQAVKMSLRAEKETTGGKRRLAKDLFRIMNQDTEEAGFSLKPSSEDCMDKWTINLFQFDEDSNLAKDMKVLGLETIELEMSFPDQYPFEPPFVRVTRPRFKRQTGFVMNGALCMELLTKDGWNPINDIESVIVSIRSLLVVGDGRLEAAYNLSDSKYNMLLESSKMKDSPGIKRKADDVTEQTQKKMRDNGGSYSVSEAQAAYSHLSDYHKKKGWDQSGWWARKG